MGEADITAVEGASGAQTAATLKVRGFDDRLPPGLKLVELIARGGMASMLLVENAAGQRFACKLADVDPRDADSVLRFEREVEIGERFAHDGVVPVLAHDDARKVIVFPFLAGGTLEQKMRRGPMPASDVKRVGRALLRTLATLHAAGVVHRDVKPANVLFDDANTGARVVYLGDLGVARDEQASFTVTGMLIGTPAYMAPEQLRGRKADAKADVYGLGATLFEAATGRRFADVAVGADVANLVVAACGDAALARTIAATVRDDPEQRPSAEEAARLLDGGGARATFVALLPMVLAVFAIGAFFAIGAWAARSTNDVLAVLPVDGVLSPRSSFGVAQLVAVRLAESDAVVKGPLDLRPLVSDASKRASWLAAARRAGATYVVAGDAAPADHDAVRLTFTLTRIDGGPSAWSSSDVVAARDALAAAGARADELAQRFSRPKKGAAEALAAVLGVENAVLTPS